MVVKWKIIWPPILRVASRIAHRIQELTKMPTTMPDDMKVKGMIELRALRLLNFQRSVSLLFVLYNLANTEKIAQLKKACWNKGDKWCKTLYGGLNEWWCGNKATNWLEILSILFSCFIRLQIDNNTNKTSRDSIVLLVNPWLKNNSFHPLDPIWSFIIFLLF